MHDDVEAVVPAAAGRTGWRRCCRRQRAMPRRLARRRRSRSRSASLSSGLVGVSIQISLRLRPDRRLAPPARFDEVDIGDVEPGRAAAHALEQPPRAAVEVVGGDDVGAAVEQRRAPSRSRQARRRRRSRPRRPRGRRCSARRPCGSGSACARIRSPCARPGSPARRSRWRRSASSPRRSSDRAPGRHGCSGWRRRGWFVLDHRSRTRKWLIRSMRVTSPRNSPRPSRSARWPLAEQRQEIARPARRPRRSRAA